jgi:hypothetical protein
MLRTPSVVLNEHTRETIAVDQRSLHQLVSHCQISVCEWSGLLHADPWGQHDDHALSGDDLDDRQAAWDGQGVDTHPRTKPKLDHDLDAARDRPLHSYPGHRVTAEREPTTGTGLVGNVAHATL